MPLRGIVNTARSLSYWERLQEVTANNVANANTEGFKADRLTARQIPGRETPVPVHHMDLSQGSLRETGRPLDVALEGAGFLMIETPQGERLFRGGSLRLDADGKLTDMMGNAVLAEEGPLVIHGAAVEVREDGDVLVDGALAGTLKIVTVDEPQELMKEGHGRFIAKQPVKAVEEGTVNLRQGAIEESNIDPVVSMVSLVAIQRAYTANIEALRVMDGVLGTITRDVGRVE